MILQWLYWGILTCLFDKNFYGLSAKNQQKKGKTHLDWFWPNWLNLENEINNWAVLQSKQQKILSWDFTRFFRLLYNLE